MEKEINPFKYQDIDNLPLEDPSSSRLGSDMFRSVQEFQVGAGNTVFRSDKQGIWLGAEKWEDAPFRVDMEGRSWANSLTLTGYLQVGDALGDVQGNISSLSSISNNLGYISAGTINGVYINGSVITGGTLQTANSGQRVVVSGSNNDIRMYNGSGQMTSIFNGNSLGFWYGGSPIGSLYATASGLQIDGGSSLILASGYIYPYSNGTELGHPSFRWNDGHFNSITLNGTNITSWPSGGGSLSSLSIDTSKYWSGYNIIGVGTMSASLFGGGSTTYIGPSIGSGVSVGSGGLTVYGSNGIYMTSSRKVDHSGGTSYFPTSSGTLKNAIVPTSKGFNALACIESPDVWFMDFCDNKDNIDPLFLEVTVSPYKFIQCDDGSYQVWGKRKGHDHIRFENKTEEEFIANERFLNMNKPIK